MEFYNFFSFSAKKAIYRASEICTQFNNQYLEPEHIFYSILNLRSCSAVQVLHQLGINLPKLTYSLEAYLYEHAGSFKGNAVFSQRTISMLDLSYKEVKRLHHREIGTTHLLIALAQDRSSFLRGLFDEHGLDARRVRDTFLSHLKGHSAGGPERKEQSNSVVAKFSRNLTEMAREGKLDPVIGREREISRMIHILSKRTKNNPILVGEPGVGKTAIVEGLSQRIVSGHVPPSLSDCDVLSIDLAGLVAGTKFRGEFEERLKALIKEIQDSNGRTIIFIDELHTILGAGSAEGSLDAGNILKPSLARGELRCIGATTFKEFRKYFEKDGALSRRFQPIFVEEPDYGETLDILRGLRKEYERHHGVQVSDTALEQAIRLSMKFIPDRKLPDKAIDLIDEASAWVNLDRETVARDSEDGEMPSVSTELSTLPFAASIEQFRTEQAGELGGMDESADELPMVNEEHVAKVVELWTGIPSQNITMDDQRRLMTLDETIRGNIIGQDEAVSTIVRSLKRNFSGVRKGGRPIGSFIFLGPTGVGKTELAKVIAKHVFAHENAFIKIDLSEYAEKHAASRLIGAPPGYVGYDEGGQLTEAVKRHPYSLILFDEMEKAHPDIFHTLLQLLDEGVLTDGQGRKVYFHNTIVIFTTNLAGRFFDEGEVIGFKREADFSDAAVGEKFGSYKHRAEEHLKKYFRPEFINRLDDTIYFRPLVKSDIMNIARLELGNLAETLTGRNLSISFDDKVVEMVVEKGYSPVYGARNIKRAIQRSVEDPLSELILNGQLPTSEAVRMTVDSEGQLAVDFDPSQLDPSGFMPEHVGAQEGE